MTTSKRNVHLPCLQKAINSKYAMYPSVTFFLKSKGTQPSHHGMTSLSSRLLF